MIDHPDLIQIPGTDQDLIKLLIVIHGIGMDPVPLIIIGKINIQQLRMLPHHSIIFQVRIPFMDQMIPDMPFPDNLDLPALIAL